MSKDDALGGMVFDALKRKIVKGLHDNAVSECVGCRYSGIAGVKVMDRMELNRDAINIEVATAFGCLESKCPVKPVPDRHKLNSGTVTINVAFEMAGLHVESTRIDIKHLKSYLGEPLKKALSEDLDISTEVKRHFSASPVSEYDATLVEPIVTIT